MKTSLFLLFALTLTGVSASPGEPYPVLLPIGQERRIEIAGAQEIRVGVPRALHGKLRVESAGSYVWLTAAHELDVQRLHLETDAGSLALEIRTDAQAPTVPVMLNPRSNAPSASQAIAPVGYVALARYAIQSLYAPGHQVVPVAGIRSVPVESDAVALFRCRKLQPAACGDAVESILHSAWKLTPYYLIAVTVRNRLAEPLQLDPRDLRGRSKASSIVHSRLEASGSPRDTTTVVLISHVPPEHVW